MANIGADIEFDAEGVTLRGLFFSAAGATRPAPCVVMAHGWAGEITHFIADFARTFSAAGIAAVVFDHRGWGRSDAAASKPRHESEPWEQIRDYQNAITYAQNRQDVDPERIGAWGSSYSAGHAFVVAAIDRRVKAVGARSQSSAGCGNSRGWFASTWKTTTTTHSQPTGAAAPEARRPRSFPSSPRTPW